MTATDTGALLRCPFCGNDVSDDEGCYPINRDRTQWEVRCGNPTCYAHSPEDYSREHAIARWNRRAPNDELDAARARIAELEKDAGRLVRTANHVAEWLTRYSDQGQYRRINGPSAGEAFDAAQSLRDAIAAMARDGA